MYTNVVSKTRVKNVIVSWVVMLLIGLIVGMVLGKNLIKESMVSADSIELEEVVFYGKIEGVEYSESMEYIEWKSKVEENFKALDIGLSEDLQEYIYMMSYAHGIEYAFVLGLIETESGFRKDLISTTDDYGLMQINKVNHKHLKEELGVKDFLDASQNIMSGMYILKVLFEKYEEPHKVLMAYNMGEAGASRLWDNGVYSTEYSNKVIKNANKYKKLLTE